jgi:hypothetical protein
MKRSVPLVVILLLSSLLVPALANDHWRCRKGQERHIGPRDRVRAEGDLRDVHEGGWSCARVRDQGRALVVHFTLADPCHGLDHVKVRYLERRIKVTVFTGGKNLPPGTGCAAVVVMARTKVELKERLAGRNVADGSRGH